MTSNALALIQKDEYQLITSLAKVAADSGYCGKNDKQAAFIMIKGYELGISPMQALDGIQVIQGKTTVSPQLMLALINRSGELEDMNIDSKPTICTVTMKRRNRSPHTEVFSMENAKSMGLAGKDNWNKQPATMLKWRAVAACARIVFPDVIQGMYTPEEMGAVVIEDSAGDVQIIEGETSPAVESLPAPIPVDATTGEIVEDKPATPKYTTTPNAVIVDNWTAFWDAWKRAGFKPGSKPDLKLVFGVETTDGLTPQTAYDKLVLWEASVAEI